LQVAALAGKDNASAIAPQAVAIAREQNVLAIGENQRWSRIFEQNFRVDKWNLCRS